MNATPGPWRYFDPIGENIGDENDYFEIQSPHEKYEAPAVGLTGFLNEADARLIAASPDMLNALHIASVALRDASAVAKATGFSVAETSATAAIMAVNAALNKAEGS